MTHDDSHPMLRVLQVVESSGGGTGRHVMDLCAGLLRRGCEVHLAYATPRTDQNFRSRLAALPTLKTLILPIRSSIHPSDLTAARTLRRYINANGPFDVIHGHSSKGGAIARLAAIACRASVYYTMHGLVVMDGGLPRLKRTIYLAAEQLLKLNTTRLIAVGPEEARQAIRLGLGRKKISTISNGVDVEPLRPRDEVRRELGLADDAIAIGFVGRLVEQKAADVLIRAFAIVAKSAPSARLVMIGNGPLEGQLRTLAGKVGVGDRILWLGERDAGLYLPALDVFAISSRKEGLPYVVLEAMAAGLPIVATESAGVESLVVPGVNGTVTAPGDVAAFGDALRALACDAPTRAKLGRGSLARVRDFSIDSMVERTLALYRQHARGHASAVAETRLAADHSPRGALAERP